MQSEKVGCERQSHRVWDHGIGKMPSGMTEQTGCSTETLTKPALQTKQNICSKEPKSTASCLFRLETTREPLAFVTHARTSARKKYKINNGIAYTAVCYFCVSYRSMGMYLA